MARPMANDPPFATLNHFTGDLGIPSESDSLRIGISPPYKSGGEADRGQVISRQPVVASCDAPEVLEPVEGTLDAPAQLVETLAEVERLLPIAAVWDDRLGSALIQFLAQFIAVVFVFAQQPFRRLHSADQTLRDRAIMRFA